MAAPVTRTPARPARRLATPLGLLAGAAAAFTYVGLVNPNHPGHYPVCPLYALTGVYCPGCGGLRCAHAVATGDLATALHDNALAVAGFAVCAVLWVRWVWRVSTGRPAGIGVGAHWGWIVGGLAVAFTVVRNLPFGAMLAP
ncbi:DUF2752 domain-containing protein [Streptomyces sp. 8L]|uniref:DUF2752 domain-containing protein n=1 Tax=Streptomyces sp. 8L TaxID=2877242 RepID=UPI001CD668DF|nr:DUF2752 domain-containing protein [Streptomyces sp. 8L]MCA1220343.1 DUF2752 domain-containing protein [Streptomyces sp. 8L]